MAILRVKCIIDLNGKLTSAERLALGPITETPKAGEIYHSDNYCFFQQWGWYIHLTEYPDKDNMWNAEKFVMADNPLINIETLLNEMYRDIIIPAQANGVPFHAN